LLIVINSNMGSAFGGGYTAEMEAKKKKKKRKKKEKKEKKGQKRGKNIKNKKKKKKKQNGRMWTWPRVF
jgi:Flp pilus assembly protein TadB